MANIEKLRKAVSYARFSSDNQRDESIDAQLRAINQYAKSNGYAIVGEYIDRAKSATTDNRPEFQRMIKDSAIGDFEFIIVHKLDRFARNRYDSAHYKHQLKRNSVRLCSVVENLDGSPESIIMESVLEGMAEYYSQNLSREVMKGMTENALKGQHTGGLPPLGYDVDKDTKKLIINECEADIVRLIFKRFIEGVGYGEIIHELNLHNYKTKRNGYFTKNSLNAILHNEKYIGIYVFNKSISKDMDGKRNSHKTKSDEDIIRIPDAVPQIISTEDFERVKTKMSRRMQTRDNSRAVETYLLRSKIECGICGGAYVGGRRKTRKPGHYFVGYMCNQRYRSKSAKCTNKEINRDFIEGVVLEELTEYVFSDKYIPYITNEYNNYLHEQNSEYQDVAKAYQKKLQRVQKNIDSIVDMLMNTQSQALLDRLQGYEHEKQQYQSEFDKLDFNNKQVSVTQEQIKKVFIKIRERLMTGNLRIIKQIIDTYVQKVLVHPDSVTIIFNFFPSINLEIPKKNTTEIERQNACQENVHVEDEQTMTSVSESQYNPVATLNYTDDVGGGEGNCLSSGNFTYLIIHIDRANIKTMSFPKAQPILDMLSVNA